jgi:hypothetical protein
MEVCTPLKLAHSALLPPDRRQGAHGSHVHSAHGGMHPAQARSQRSFFFILHSSSELSRIAVTGAQPSRAGLSVKCVATPSNLAGVPERAHQVLLQAPERAAGRLAERGARARPSGSVRLRTHRLHQQHDGPHHHPGHGAGTALRLLCHSGQRFVCLRIGGFWHGATENGP